MSKIWRGWAAYDDQDEEWCLFCGKRRTEEHENVVVIPAADYDATIKQLAEAEKYLQHMQSCDLSHYDPDKYEPKCTCGLETFLSESGAT